MAVISSHPIGKWRGAVDLVWLLLTCALILGLAFFLEGRISRMERRARSRELHPSGSRCPDCGSQVSDWDAHRRLFHQVRVAAPEDKW